MRPQGDKETRRLKMFKQETKKPTKVVVPKTSNDLEGPDYAEKSTAFGPPCGHFLDLVDFKILNKYLYN